MCMRYALPLFLGITIATYIYSCWPTNAVPVKWPQTEGRGPFLQPLQRLLLVRWEGGKKTKSALSRRKRDSKLKEGRCSRNRKRKEKTWRYDLHRAKRFLFPKMLLLLLLSLTCMRDATVCPARISFAQISLISHMCSYHSSALKVNIFKDTILHFFVINLSEVKTQRKKNTLGCLPMLDA